MFRFGPESGNLNGGLGVHRQCLQNSYSRQEKKWGCTIAQQTSPSARLKSSGQVHPRRRLGSEVDLLWMGGVLLWFLTSIKALAWHLRTVPPIL